MADRKPLVVSATGEASELGASDTLQVLGGASVAKALALGGAQLTTSSANNVSVTGRSVLPVIASGSAATLTGFAGNGNAQCLVVYNAAVGLGFDVIIAHESASSSAANRVICHTGADIDLPASGAGVVMVYDVDATRWRTVGFVERNPTFDTVTTTTLDASGNVTTGGDLNVTGFSTLGGAEFGGAVSYNNPVTATETTRFAVNQTAHGLSVGMPIYHDGSEWNAADRDSDTTTGAAIVVAVASANAFSYSNTNGPVSLTTGQWDARTGDSGGLTAGEFYWLSSTAGGLTKTMPTTGIRQAYGLAISTTTLLLSIGEPFDIDAGGAGGSSVDTIPVTFNGFGAVVEVGAFARWRAPAAGTITKVTTLADVSGSIVIDIYKDTYANYPPTNADSITASAPPTISSATKSEDATLPGWTASFSAGDVLRFEVESATNVTNVTLLLDVEYG